MSDTEQFYTLKLECIGKFQACKRFSEMFVEFVLLMLNLTCRRPSVYRDGFVSLQEYMAFMISRETENVQSAREVEAAFRALTTGDKPYITANELFAVSCSLVYLFAPVDDG